MGAGADRPRASQHRPARTPPRRRLPGPRHGQRDRCACGGCGADPPPRAANSSECRPRTSDCCACHPAPLRRPAAPAPRHIRPPDPPTFPERAAGMKTTPGAERKGMTTTTTTMHCRRLRAHVRAHARRRRLVLWVLLYEYCYMSIVRVAVAAGCPRCGRGVPAVWPRGARGVVAGCPRCGRGVPAVRPRGARAVAAGCPRCALKVVNPCRAFGAIDRSVCRCWRCDRHQQPQ